MSQKLSQQQFERGESEIQRRLKFTLLAVSRASSVTSLEVRNLQSLNAAVRIPIGESLGDTIGKLKTWLDGQKIVVAQYTTTVDGKGYKYTVRFRNLDDADRFRAQFRLP